MGCCTRGGSSVRQAVRLAAFLHAVAVGFPLATRGRGWQQRSLSGQCARGRWLAGWWRALARSTPQPAAWGRLVGGSWRCSSWQAGSCGRGLGPCRHSWQEGGMGGPGHTLRLLGKQQLQQLRGDYMGAVSQAGPVAGWDAGVAGQGLGDVTRALLRWALWSRGQ